jgi:hypothetical protein
MYHHQLAEDLLHARWLSRGPVGGTMGKLMLGTPTPPSETYDELRLSVGSIGPPCAARNHM